MKLVDLSGTSDRWTFHRLPEALAELGVAPAHVLHLGANLGQEVPDYRRAGIGRITLVEPDPDSAAKLRGLFGANPDITIIEAACGTQAGTGMLRRTDGADVWSTLATTPLPHGRQVTSTVPVQVHTVAEIQGDADMLVIDTQGTELDVLQSSDLSTVKVVIIETHASGDPHAHAADFDQTVAYMATVGWRPALQWRHERPSSSWFATFSDTFFVPSK